MSHKDDIDVLSGRLHRIIGQLCELEDDLGIIYDELDISEQTCEIYRVVNTRDIRKCSACGILMNFSHPLDRSHLNYCPNCGAKVVNE